MAKSLDEKVLKDAIYIDKQRNVPVVTSVSLATCIGRSHSIVMNAIRERIDAFDSSYTKMHFWKNGNRYIMTKDGFMMTASSFNGGHYMKNVIGKILRKFHSMERLASERTNNAADYISLMWNDLVHTKMSLHDVIQERDLYHEQRNIYRNYITAHAQFTQDASV